MVCNEAQLDLFPPIKKNGNQCVYWCVTVLFFFSYHDYATILIVLLRLREDPLANLKIKFEHTCVRIFDIQNWIIRAQKEFKIKCFAFEVT